MTGRQVDSPAIPNESGISSTDVQRGVQLDDQSACIAAPNAPGRHAGRFLPGHKETARHYLDSDRVPAAYLEMEAALLAQSVADDGGASEIPARRMAQHEYRAQVHRRVRQLSDALDTYGLFDKRRKLRVAWIQRLEALIALATRIDSTLGLERRTKSVANPLAYIRGEADL